MLQNTIQQQNRNFDPDAQEFKELGYRMIRIINGYYQKLNDLPVFPGSTPQKVADTFAEELPQEGQNPHQLLDDWVSKVLPNSTNVGSPRHFGYVNGSGTMIGVLAEALAASVNMNLGAWNISPAGTEIEKRVIAWLGEMIGYGRDSGGLMTSGGTMANLTAIHAALRSSPYYNDPENGLQAIRRSGRFTVYISDHEGHVSVTRIADLLNLGKGAVRLVPSKEDFTMDVESLQWMLNKDRARGDIPFCVIGQAGSINVGAVDPLGEIARVCSENNIWFHVDGAIGAVGAILPEKRHLYAGLERADSVTLDPHKWLYVPYECGSLLVKDANVLKQAFDMQAGYLQGIIPTEYSGIDYLEYGPQMSRGFNALKLWMSLKYYGVGGYRRMLSRNVRCAEYLDNRVEQSSCFEKLHEPTLHIYSFRFVPEDLQNGRGDSELQERAINAYLDRLNQQIADAIRAEGTAFIMTTRLRERTVLRMSICSHRTGEADVDRVFNKLLEFGQAIDKSQRSPYAPQLWSKKRRRIVQLGGNYKTDKHTTAAI